MALASSSGLCLKPASKLQVIQTNKNVFQFWGKGLSEEDFIKREKLLSSCTFTSDNLTAWVLVKSDDPEGLNLYSHLETFERKAFYNHKETGFQKRTVHSIASVYTPEQHRKQGYASAMFKKLVPILNSNNSIGSILYSDIGTYYERFGYELYSPFHTKFEVKSFESSFSENVGLLSEEDIKNLAQLDCSLLESKIKNWDFNANNNSEVFAIEPTYDVYDWHWHRAKFYSNIKNLSTPTIFGALYKDEEQESNPQFLIWTYDHNTKELYILRHSLSTKAFELVNTVLAQARKEGMEYVVGWNIDSKLFDNTALSSVAQVTRREQDSLPYLCPSIPNSKEGDLAWVDIQKYGWV